jgi:hypothetical protein
VIFLRTAPRLGLVVQVKTRLPKELHAAQEQKKDIHNRERVQRKTRHSPAGGRKDHGDRRGASLAGRLPAEGHRHRHCSDFSQAGIIFLALAWMHKDSPCFRDLIQQPRTLLGVNAGLVDADAGGLAKGRFVNDRGVAFVGRDFQQLVARGRPLIPWQVEPFAVGVEHGNNLEKRFSKKPVEAGLLLPCVARSVPKSSSRQRGCGGN